MKLFLQRCWEQKSENTGERCGEWILESRQIKMEARSEFIFIKKWKNCLVDRLVFNCGESEGGANKYIGLKES